MLPEVIFLAKLIDALRRDADLISPDGKRLVIFQIHGRIETVRVKSYDLREKLPGPVDGLPLKIISKGEVTEHLKKCTVTRRLTYVLNVTGTDTLLAGSHPSSRRDLLSGKVWLERSHTGVDQKQAVIIMRNQ